jgi:hypothetical protein
VRYRLLSSRSHAHVVHEQDEPAGCGVSWPHVGGHRARGRGWRYRRIAGAQVERFEARDRLRLAVLGEDEIGRGEAAHRPTFAVDHHGIHRDELHARRERGHVTFVLGRYQGDHERHGGKRRESHGNLRDHSAIIDSVAGSVLPTLSPAT